MAPAVLVALLGITAVACLDITLTARYDDGSGDSKALFVRGDGCGLSWDAGAQMQQHSGDTSFSLSLSCDDTVSEVQYKVLVEDQVWQIGANEVAKPTSASTSFVTFPWFYATNGTLHIIPNVYSPQLRNQRDIIVYLPPSFTENLLKPYADVLLMHDGNNLFAANTCPSCCPFGCWDLQQQALDPLTVSGAIREVAVVGVYNTVNRTSEYTYSRDPSNGGGDGDKYLDFLQAQALPAALAAFPRLRPAQGRVSMIGSSLGGLISCYAGWRRSDVYARVGCMSSSFWWNSQDFLNVILASDPVPEKHLDIYLDSGDSGPGKDDEAETLAVRSKLHSLGFTESGSDANLAYYLDKGGQHNEGYWGARVWRPLVWFFGTGQQG